jgi:hypothetical protein
LTRLAIIQSTRSKLLGHKLYLKKAYLMMNCADYSVDTL